jgi:hypothetical protein
MVAVAPHYLYVIGGQTTASPQVNVVDSAHLADVQVFDLASLRYGAVPKKQRSAVGDNMPQTRANIFSKCAK